MTFWDIQKQVNEDHRMCVELAKASKYGNDDNDSRNQESIPFWVAKPLAIERLGKNRSKRKKILLFHPGLSVKRLFQ